MIKKRLAAIAAAAFAACSMCSTAAFAASYPFGGVTLTTGVAYRTASQIKTDELHAVVNVEEGLAGGDYYATFEVHKYVNDALAAGPKDLWINGRHYLDYLSGMAIKGERYYLRYYMEPQANAERIAIRGKWEP